MIINNGGILNELQSDWELIALNSPKCRFN